MGYNEWQGRHDRKYACCGLKKKKKLSKFTKAQNNLHQET